MATVIPGRHSAELDGDFVVFIIGMRINHLRKVSKWLPVLKAMPKMVKELSEQPAKGLLAVEWALAGRTSVIVQYWRSYDDLEHFSRDPDDLHYPAWRAFNKAIGSSGDVGVYHETYKVHAGDHEAIYVNMPEFGLAKAGEMVPVGRRGDSSRERIEAAAAVGS